MTSYSNPTYTSSSTASQSFSDQYTSSSSFNLTSDPLTSSFSITSSIPLSNPMNPSLSTSRESIERITKEISSIDYDPLSFLTQKVDESLNKIEEKVEENLLKLFTNLSLEFEEVSLNYNKEIDKMNKNSSEIELNLLSDLNYCINDLSYIKMSILTNKNILQNDILNPPNSSLITGISSTDTTDPSSSTSIVTSPTDTTTSSTSTVDIMRICSRLLTSEKERLNIEKSLQLLSIILEFQNAPPNKYNNIENFNSEKLRSVLPVQFQSISWLSMSELLYSLNNILNECESEEVAKAAKILTKVSNSVENELLGSFDISMNEIMNYHTNYPSILNFLIKSPTTSSSTSFSLNELSSELPADVLRSYEEKIIKLKNITKALHLFNNGVSLHNRYLFSVIQKRIPSSIIINKESKKKKSNDTNIIYNTLKNSKQLIENTENAIKKMNTKVDEFLNPNAAAASTPHHHIHSKGAKHVNVNTNTAIFSSLLNLHGNKDNSDYDSDSDAGAADSIEDNNEENDDDDNDFYKELQRNNRELEENDEDNDDDGDKNSQLMDHLSSLFSMINRLCLEQFAIIRNIFPYHIIAKITRNLIQRIFGDPAFGIQARVDAILSPQSKKINEIMSEINSGSKLREGDNIGGNITNFLLSIGSSAASANMNSSNSNANIVLLLSEYLDGLLTIREKLSALNLLLLECSSHTSLIGMGSETAVAKKARGEKSYSTEKPSEKPGNKNDNLLVTNENILLNNEEDANNNDEIEEKLRSDNEIREFFDDQISYVLVNYVNDYYDKELLYVSQQFNLTLKKFCPDSSILYKLGATSTSSNVSSTASLFSSFFSTSPTTNLTPIQQLYHIKVEKIVSINQLYNSSLSIFNTKQFINLIFSILIESFLRMESIGRDNINKLLVNIKELYIIFIYFVINAVYLPSCHGLLLIIAKNYKENVNYLTLNFQNYPFNFNNFSLFTLISSPQSLNDDPTYMLNISNSHLFTNNSTLNSMLILEIFNITSIMYYTINKMNKNYKDIILKNYNNYINILIVLNEKKKTSIKRLRKNLNDIIHNYLYYLMLLFDKIIQNNFNKNTYNFTTNSSFFSSSTNSTSSTTFLTSNIIPSPLCIIISSIFIILKLQIEKNFYDIHTVNFNRKIFIPLARYFLNIFLVKLKNFKINGDGIKLLKKDIEEYIKLFKFLNINIIVDLFVCFLDILYLFATKKTSNIFYLIQNKLSFLDTNIVFILLRSHIDYNLSSTTFLSKTNQDHWCKKLSLIYPNFKSDLLYPWENKKVLSVSTLIEASVKQESNAYKSLGPISFRKNKNYLFNSTYNTYNKIDETAGTIWKIPLDMEIDESFNEASLEEEVSSPENLFERMNLEEEEEEDDDNEKLRNISILETYSKSNVPSTTPSTSTSTGAPSSSSTSVSSNASSSVQPIKPISPPPPPPQSPSIVSSSPSLIRTKSIQVSRPDLIGEVPRPSSRGTFSLRNMKGVSGGSPSPNPSQRLNRSPSPSIVRLPSSTSPLKGAAPIKLTNPPPRPSFVNTQTSSSSSSSSSTSTSAPAPPFASTSSSTSTSNSTSAPTEKGTKSMLTKMSGFFKSH